MAILGAESESLSSQLQSVTQRLEASDCRVTKLTDEINTAKVWQPQCTMVHYSPETFASHEWSLAAVKHVKMLWFRHQTEKLELLERLRASDGATEAVSELEKQRESLTIQVMSMY